MHTIKGKPKLNIKNINILTYDTISILQKKGSWNIITSNNLNI